MFKIIEFILNNAKKLFNKQENNILLPKNPSQEFLDFVLRQKTVLDFENCVNSNVNIPELKNKYNNFYNFSLINKLTPYQTIELVKDFFNSLDKDFSNRANAIIDGNDNRYKFIFEKYGMQVDRKGRAREAEVTNFEEVFVPIKGDLRDAYSTIHEVGHIFDLDKGDTEARKCFGEVGPQCLERLFDEFLLNLSDKQMKKYNFSRESLFRDIIDRRITTFLTRFENVRKFNNNTGNRPVDLRYVFAQLYSFAFISSKNNMKIAELHNFMNNVANNDMNACSKSFGIDLTNKIQIQRILHDISNDINNNYNQILQQEALNEILDRSKSEKVYKVTLGNQNIHINLEADVPFVFVSPYLARNGQALVMESNNLETNNMQSLLVQALGTAKQLNDCLNGESPILIPILPSPSSTAPYYQQLSVDSFRDGNRPDLSVVEDINQVKNIMKEEYGVDLNDKIFLNGYSSSGCFAQRFALIHPEIIDTACIGGASGSIPIPSEDLEYPLGIKNFEKIFGKEFNYDEYKKITFNYYVGSCEGDILSSHNLDENGELAPMHDMSYFPRSVPTQVGLEQRRMFGTQMMVRALKIVKYLRENGINITHIIHSNIAHNEKEAYDIREKTLNMKIKGIRAIQDKIVKSYYDEMKYKLHRERNNKVKDGK